MEDIIVCRTADGDLIKYDGFKEAIESSIAAAGKDLSEIVITASNNYRCIINRKIGRKGLLLHDVLEDKNATDDEKASARKDLEEIEKGMKEETYAQLEDIAAGRSTLGIESVQIVYYKGSCDNVYVKSQEYYDAYKKRQEMNR